MNLTDAASRLSPPAEKKWQPTDSTLKKIENVLASLKNGANITEACEAAKVSRDTFYDWKNLDPKNEARIHAILDNSRVLEAEDCLFAQIRKGNIVAIIFYLCNRKSERWKRMENTNIPPADGPEKLPVIVQIGNGKHDGDSKLTA